MRIPHEVTEIEYQLHFIALAVSDSTFPERFWTAIEMNNLLLESLIMHSFQRIN